MLHNSFFSMLSRFASCAIFLTSENFVFLFLFASIHCFDFINALYFKYKKYKTARIIAATTKKATKKYTNPLEAIRASIGEPVSRIFTF